MLGYTVDHYRKHLEDLQAKNRNRIAEIERQIDDHEQKGLGTKHLYEQLDQARRLAASSEKLAKQNLKNAEKVAQEKEAQEAERLKAASSEIESRRKKAAKAVWIAQGGKPDEFEAAWDAMWKEILKAETIRATVEQTVEQKELSIFREL